MQMLVVFDTNVLVSAIVSHNLNSTTVKVVKTIYDGKTIPLYNEEILSEYDEVLHRSKFNFDESEISNILEAIVKTGVYAKRTCSNESFPDPKDAMFYEVALSKEGSFVVTGNTKHFPKDPIVVTPAELLEILTNL